MNDVIPLREPITGISGCPTAVRALRECFQPLIANHTDPKFTGRLMQIVAEIYRRDVDGERSKRSICFSREMRLLSTIVFNKRSAGDEILLWRFNRTHSGTRTTAMLSVEECRFRYDRVPSAATHFRILNHLGVVSDYGYNDDSRMYEPLGRLNGINVTEYSDYLTIQDGYRIELEVSLPVWCHPSEDDTVIQIMGIEYYVKSGQFEFLPMGRKGGVVICDVF